MLLKKNSMGDSIGYKIPLLVHKAYSMVDQSRTRQDPVIHRIGLMLDDESRLGRPCQYSNKALNESLWVKHGPRAIAGGCCPQLVAER